jgi:double-strand break repair protein MRE11
MILTGIGSLNEGQSLSILNVLSSAGLINYFGKHHNKEEITVEPLLLQKGVTKLAVFGLGSMNEGR